MTEENKNSLELVVQDEALLKEVTFNYAELKSGLENQLKKYNELVVTEDAIKPAKEDRANLNKLEKALGDKGNDIKTKLLGGFDKKLSELRGLVKQASQSIDTQVKKFEEAEKAKKKAEIEKFYAENIGDLKALVPFSQLFNDKMLNVGMSMKKCEAEITEGIERVTNDLKVIDTLGVTDDILIPVKDYYLKTFNLSGALVEKSRLEQKKAALAEYQRQKESEVKKEEVKPVSVQETPKTEVPTQTVQQPEQKFKTTFWVETDKTQLAMIGAFFATHKINYGKVEG